ncbi:class I adenylate-forming enzyme family protein [Sphingomonas sp. BIUV-7]|uniref:Long-chain-fatty-acid--CoA ligase n=1 Tax=Sphingomonas natans TaxID=3063330 RepID=A0ABT8YCX7_9SPHN|nr:class I adenylate-forming enzyme family protein [Sphingomonas sp. BIUV-7]MDO6416183.1 class I adenylate-forming enzyme family protein [Sphingomonas sp. BIUV-7]
MKPINLEALIGGSRDPCEPAILSPDCGWSLMDLIKAGSCAALELAVHVGVVAICCRDPMRMVVALVALDGRVDRLILLANDLDRVTIEELLERSGARILVTDREDLDDFAPAIRWRGEVEPVRSARFALGEPDRLTIWTFATSGTTGAPKLVEHDIISLSRPLRAEHAWRWGQMYEMARFAGVQVFLQAMAKGVLILPHSRWPLKDKVAFIATNGGNAISATPTLWRKMLMTPEAATLQLHQATLGGEIADAPVLATIAARYPSARVTHVYASTEAGASFAVNDGLPGFPAAMLDIRGSGPCLRIRDGRLFIQSARGRRTYVGTNIAFSDDEGFVDTGDLVERVGERCYFKGRANGVINVGGDKVYPQEVEAVLLAHPDVALARIFAASSPITGQMVSAEIMMREEVGDRTVMTRKLHAYCAERLPRWKCPVIIRLVREIAANSGEKMSRAK